jgi:hypothetical protein
MKRKMHVHIQPSEVTPPRHEQVQAEIQSFLQAVDSYPARVAKQPGLTFQQHLSQVFAAHEIRYDGRRDATSRRH